MDRGKASQVTEIPLRCNRNGRPVSLLPLLSRVRASPLGFPSASPSQAEVKGRAAARQGVRTAIYRDVQKGTADSRVLELRPLPRRIWLGSFFHRGLRAWCWKEAPRALTLPSPSSFLSSLASLGLPCLSIFDRTAPEL